MANFTEKMIMTTFLEMLEKRSFDKITVKDIIEELGISRNTFYYHFEDIYDLAKKVANNELEKMYQIDFTNRNLQDLMKSITFETNKSRKQIYHMINTVDRKLLEEYIYNATNKAVELYIQETLSNLDCDQDSREVVVKCYTCAIVGVIMKWIDDGMKDDIDFLLKAVDLFAGSIANALQKG